MVVGQMDDEQGLEDDDNDEGAGGEDDVLSEQGGPAPKYGNVTHDTQALNSRYHSFLGCLSQRHSGRSLSLGYLTTESSNIVSSVPHVSFSNANFHTSRRSEYDKRSTFNNRSVSPSAYRNPQTRKLTRYPTR